MCRGDFMKKCLEKDELIIKDFREMCVGLITPLEVRILDEMLSKFFNDYYKNVEQSINTQIELNKKNDDFYDESDVYYTFGFDVLQDLLTNLMMTEVECNSEIIGLEDQIKYEKSNGFFNERYENLSELNQELRKYLMIKGLVPRIKEIYFEVYPDRVLDVSHGAR